MGRRKKTETKEPKKETKKRGRPPKADDKSKKTPPKEPQKVEIKEGTLSVKRTSFGGTRISEKAIKMTPIVTSPAMVYYKVATRDIRGE